MHVFQNENFRPTAAMIILKCGLFLGLIWVGVLFLATLRLFGII